MVVASVVLTVSVVVAPRCSYDSCQEKAWGVLEQVLGAEPRGGPLPMPKTPTEGMHRIDIQERNGSN